jgi:hypothetical protein
VVVLIMFGGDDARQDGNWVGILSVLRLMRLLRLISLSKVGGQPVFFQHAIHLFQVHTLMTASLLEEFPQP